MDIVLKTVAVVAASACVVFTLHIGAGLANKAFVEPKQQQYQNEINQTLTNLKTQQRLYELKAALEALD